MDSGLASASLRRPGMTRLTKVDTLASKSPDSSRGGLEPYFARLESPVGWAKARPSRCTHADAPRAGPLRLAHPMTIHGELENDHRHHAGR